MNMKRAMSFLLVVLVGVNVLANTPSPLPAEDDWRFMTFEKKHERMTFVIHPVMMERFQKFYKTEAPELTCVSCHGEAPERVDYDLANTSLKALSRERVRLLYVEDAVLTKEQAFKRDNITPTMARLLGVPAYDPNTGLGFSCFGCHRYE